METRGIALAIIQRLGVWSGPPPAEARHTVDGLHAALEALSRRGYRMGIVSNVTYAPFLAWALDAHGLRGHFERPAPRCGG